MLTPSDHYISANSAAADQLCDVAVIWAAAICCRLPDFTPYLPTPLVFFFFFFLWLLHSLIFSRLLSVCFCLLSEDQALNEISDGGWGKPRPEALWAFSAVFFFFFFFGRSDGVRVTFSQSGRETKRQNKPSSVRPSCFTPCNGHGLFVKQWLVQNPISWHYYNKKTNKQNKSFSSAVMNSTDAFIYLLGKRHGIYRFVPSRISEYINNADSMNYSNPPATM